MNYLQLKNNVADWIHRSDLSSQIVVFIEMARSRIAHDLNSMHLEVRATGTMTSEYTDLPSNLVEIRSLKIDGRRINYWTEDQIVQSGFDSATGHEAIYTIVANQIRVIGAPSSANYELVYKAIPAAMSADDDQDVILANYPQLYMYACELEYLLYSENETRAAQVVNYYKDAITQINDASSYAKYPAGTLAVRAN